MEINLIYMSKNIAIIGGGIGGLTTALCFEKLNIPYTLYEKTPVIKEVGAGIWLPPNALQVFEWINPQLLKAIIDSGNSLDVIRLADHQLKSISNSEQTFVKEKFGYTTIAIHRGTLQKILLNFCDQKNIQLNKGFEKYSINSDTSFNIHFSDNTIVKSDSILGADGLNSKVRNQLFPKSNLRYSGQTCWRGISNFTLPNELTNVGFTLWGKQLQFGVSKIAQDKVYWFAVKLSPPNYKGIDNHKEHLLHLFSEFTPIVNQLISNTTVEKIIKNDIYDLNVLSKWHNGEICLLGDAAHGMTPDLGQGGAQAIEDAYFISNFLKRYRLNFNTAYNEFYKHRKPKVQHLVRQSRFTSKIAITNKIGELIRNFILKSTPDKLMQKQMYSIYKLNNHHFI
ncbi:FAD_binding_3 domain-containing protein [Tenacibaculum sp. 190524A02b]